ncbi:hypothetical protein GCM10009595_13440 [Falsarthrobacter nasiphocae]
MVDLAHRISAGQCGLSSAPQLRSDSTHTRNDNLLIAYADVTPCPPDVAASHYQDHELIVLDVVDDPVVADANAELAVPAAQLQTSRRTRNVCEVLDSSLQGSATCG